MARGGMDFMTDDGIKHRAVSLVQESLHEQEGWMGCNPSIAGHPPTIRGVVYFATAKEL